MGSIGDCFDHSGPDRLFPTLPVELLDRYNSPTREGLAQPDFAFNEGFYNPSRRHPPLGYLSPAHYQRQHAAGRPTGTAA